MNNKGLTTAEALERAKQGKNVLTQGKKKSLFSVIAEQFASPLLLLLVAASVISIMTGEIVDGIIIIGRNPQRCTLLYPKDEKGISSVHCRLQKNSECILLTDLGSQFGTFVNGQRLNANSPFELQKGDTFWLADHVNSFYII